MHQAGGSQPSVSNARLLSQIHDQAAYRRLPGSFPTPRMAGKRFKALLRGTFKRDHDKPSANSSPAPSRSSTPVQAAADHGSAQSVTTGQDTQSTTVQQGSRPFSIDQDNLPGTAGQNAQSLGHAPTPEPRDTLPTVVASDHAQDRIAATPIDVTPEDERVAAAQSLEDPNSLWKAAYRLLQKREPDLAAAYADHLLPGSTADTLTSSDSVASVVEGLQAEREAKQWKFEVRGRSVKVRGQIEKLAKFLVWTDGVVKTAVSAQPYAALAWSAISIFIPAMLEGLESITRVQIFWKMYDTSASTEPQSKDFVDLVTDLYSMIIEYQARVICHLSLRQRSRAWVNITGGTTWEAEVKDIHDIDERCRIFLDQTQKRKTEEVWQDQLSTIFKSQKVLEQIHEALVTTRQQYDDDTERQILEQLFANHEGYKNDLNPPRTGGTCEWFFQDHRYLRWRDSNESSLLWVSAGPGCGKSVLSRALIDEHRLSISASTSTICYFFFKDGDERRTTCAAALSAILHQIFIQDQSGQLINKAKAAYKNAGNNFGTTCQPLWDILIDCVGSRDTGDVICLIDAVDECEKLERQKLVNLLKQFYGDSTQSSTSANLRFIVTSRPYDHIEVLFGNLSAAVESSSAYIRFDGNDKIDEINKEIDLVIDEKVRGLPGRFKPKDQLEISRRLREKQNRTYLWLQLVFRIIADSPSDYSRPLDINALLDELPTELSEMYGHILDKSISNQRKVDALFHILLAANQPLTIKEADEALTAALRGSPFESLDEYVESTWQEGFEGVAQNLTGFLVVASSEDGWADKTLVFTHQTVREFLTHHEPEGNWRGKYKSATSQQMMASTCFRVLSIPNYTLQMVDSLIYMPFIERYARSQWNIHYDNLDLYQKEALFGDTLNLLQKDLLQRNTHGSASLLNDRPWMNSKMIEAKELFQELGMACFLDLDFVVGKLLSDTIDINRQSQDEDEIDLKSLIRRTMSRNKYRTDSGLSLLHLAVSSESTKVVKLLLKRGANPCLLTTTLGKSPLDEAVTRHYYGIAELLVGHKRGIPVHDSTCELLMGWFDGLDATPFLELLLKNDPYMKITPKMLSLASERNALQSLSIFVDKGKFLPASWKTLKALLNDGSEVSVIIEFLLDHFMVAEPPEANEKFFPFYFEIITARRNPQWEEIFLSLISTKFMSDDVLSASAFPPKTGSDGVKTVLEQSRKLSVDNVDKVLTCGLTNERHGDKILELLFIRYPGIEITEAIIKQAALNRNPDMVRPILALLLGRTPAATVTRSTMRHALEEFPSAVDLFIEKQTNFEILEEFIGNVLSKWPYSYLVDQSRALDLNCSETLLRQLLENHRDSCLVRELIAVQVAKMAVCNSKRDPMTGQNFRPESEISSETLGVWLSLFSEEEPAPMTLGVLNCMQYYGESDEAVERALSVFFEAPTVRILTTVPVGEGHREMTKGDALDYVEELRKSDARRQPSQYRPFEDWRNASGIWSNSLGSLSSFDSTSES